MSNPVIANRVPAPWSVAGVLDYVQFSLRNEDSQIRRDSLNTYIGYGAAFYQGQDLPENLEFPRIPLRSFGGAPVGEVDRAIDNDALLITSSVGPEKKGLYYLGGLQAPATPGQPVMIEFTLELDHTETSQSGQTGVVAGLFFDDTGFMLRFGTSGAVQSIEMFDANPSSTQRVLPATETYRSFFDWSSYGSEAHTYKVLWDPVRDRVAVYASRNYPDGALVSTTDELLIDGAVSDFPPVIAGNEERDQPWMFFGQGFYDSAAISRWYNAYIYHLVTVPHVNGSSSGEHEGHLLTNNIYEFTGDQRIDRADRAWSRVPELFDSGDGSILSVGGVNELRNIERTFGFVREEPRVKLGVTIVDFELAGDILLPDPTSEASGIEVYVDGGPGSFEARVGLLEDSSGARYVGLLGEVGSPTAISSYAVLLRGWGSFVSYRLIVDPSVGATLYEVLPAGDVQEAQLATMPLSRLPPSTKITPGIGVMHNGYSSQAKTLIRLKSLSYMTNVVQTNPADLPTDQGWTRQGAGSYSELVGAVYSLDADGEVYYERTESNLDADNGYSIEFRMRIPSYEAAGQTNPERTVPGAGLSVDDASNRLFVMFAEAGGKKIVFLAKIADVEENLRLIRSLDPRYTYAEVDWSVMHTYRLDRTVGGNITLLVDGAAVLQSPEFQFPPEDGPYAPTEGDKFIKYGNFLDHHKVLSEWAYVRYNVSDGLDVRTRPTFEEEEALSLFDHALNVIVEVEDV